MMQYRTVLLHEPRILHEHINVSYKGKYTGQCPFFPSKNLHNLCLKKVFIVFNLIYYYYY